MTYFIVETSYEKCFELFFKDELQYPNFYRMNELLSSVEYHPEWVLITPSNAPSIEFSQKIMQTIDQLGIRYHRFGHDLSTSFHFHTDGKIRTEATFEKALCEALQAFKNIK